MIQNLASSIAPVSIRGLLGLIREFMCSILCKRLCWHELETRTIGDPEYFKKSLSITLGALGAKGIENGFNRTNNSNSKNLVKPILNSVVGESSPRIIDILDSELNKGE